MTGSGGGLTIYLSYRRADGAAWAAGLYDHLADRFGKDRVMIDAEMSGVGTQWALTRRSYDSFGIVLAIIGPKWLDEMMQRADEEDFVRMELEMALRARVRLIPVLVGGAQMPRRGDLPPALQDLANHQAFAIDPETWNAGVERLMELLSTYYEAAAGVPWGAVERSPNEGS